MQGISTKRMAARCGGCAGWRVEMILSDEEIKESHAPYPVFRDSHLEANAELCKANARIRELEDKNRCLEMQIRPRSSISKLGVQAFLGTIDPDYRGEVCIMLYNSSPDRYQVKKGDRIAQGVIAPVARVHFELAESLSDTERGEGGFGSTGVR